MKYSILIVLFLTFVGCVTTADQRYQAPSLDKKDQISDADWKSDGVYREYYRTGGLKSVKSYENGRLNGICREYSEDGILKTATQYTDDKIDGFHNTYYPNGSMWLNEIYDSGKILERRIYDEDGYETVENFTENKN